MRKLELGFGRSVPAGEFGKVRGPPSFSGELVHVGLSKLGHVNLLAYVNLVCGRLAD